MNPNQSYPVPIYPDLQCRWSLVCDVPAATVSEGFDFVLGAAETVFKELSDFVVPSELSYNVQVYPPESPLSYPTGDPPGQNQLDVLECELADPEGLTYTDFERSIPAAEGNDRHIQRIEASEVTTWLLFDGDLIPTDRTQNTQLLRGGEPVDEQHVYDPVTFDIRLVRNYDESDVDTDAVLYVDIWSKTDLWFRDTDVGEINAERLSAAMGEIAETLDPVRIARESDRYTPEDLLEIL